MGDGLIDEMWAAARARVGQEIGGKYRLEALIGVGGTAAVYAASHRNGHRVAVKISHKKVYASPALWARFLRESYLGNVLEHDGVVRVTDDDVTQDGAAYLVMELLQGASLRAIAAELPLDVAYVAAVGDAVLDVLAVAHQKGIVHRDVKPENIFLTDEGALKLLDFGVARQLGPYGPAVTTTGAILGTPAFMAPEQVLGRGPLLGPPTDLWSVGATLFTLISGQHVHEGSTAGELFVSVATRPARPLASVAPSCPTPICEVVDRALRRESEDRWADADAMRAALGEAFRASFGKPIDPKALLGRMARELLPLVAGAAGPAGGGDADAPTEGATWSGPTSPPIRPPGPRASGYRDLPLTLRDAAAASSSPPLVRFGADGVDGVAPTERAPEVGPFLKKRPRSDSRPFLFQDSTLVSQGETAPPPGVRRRNALLVLGLAAAVGVSGALGFGMSRAGGTLPMLSDARPPAAERRPPSPARPQLPARSAGAGEADAAFGEAFQLWFDGAPSRARGRFLDAARLDPSRAEAHLYSVVVSEWVDLSDREHFARARSLRGGLSEHDAGLLEALEPLLAEPPVPAEAEARLARWARAYAGDAVSRMVQGQFAVRSRRVESALALAPEIGGALGHWVGGVAHLQRGEPEAGARELERCAAASPAAVDCLTSLVTLELNEGRCEAAEQTARKLVAADSDSTNAFRFQAGAVMGQTHSTEQTRAILRHRWARLPADKRPAYQAAEEFFLHVYDGEFGPAREDMARWQAANAGSVDAWWLAFSFENQIDFELELGNPEGAVEVARAMALAGRAWLPDAQFDAPSAVDRQLYLTGLLPRDEFGRRRALAAQRIGGLGGYYEPSPGLLWYDLYVWPVKDERDAREALRVEPAGRALMSPTEKFGNISAALGRTYLLGSRVDDSARELERAAKACSYGQSLERVRALLWLGDARLAKNDRAGACEAYAEVSARWGADGRSVTARLARERSAAARCPGQRAGARH